MSYTKILCSLSTAFQYSKGVVTNVFYVWTIFFQTVKFQSVLVQSTQVPIVSVYLPYYILIIFSLNVDAFKGGNTHSDA